LLVAAGAGTVITTLPAGVVDAAVAAGLVLAVPPPLPPEAKASKHATELGTAQQESGLDWLKLVQNWHRPLTCYCYN